MWVVNKEQLSSSSQQHIPPQKRSVLGRLTHVGKLGMHILHMDVEARGQSWVSSSLPTLLSQGGGASTHVPWLECDISLPPPRGSLGSVSGPQVWQQGLCSAEACCPFLHPLLESGSSTEPGPHQLANSAAQQTPGIDLSLPHPEPPALEL